MPLTSYLPYLITTLVAGAAIWRGAPYPLFALMMMIMWYAVRHAYQYRAYGKVAQTSGEAREKLLVLLTGLGMVYVPLFAYATPIFDFAYYLPGRAQMLAGLAAAVPGLVLFWRSHEDLGLNWSPMLETRDNHTLVTRGVYARIRHPMYTSIFLLCLAQLLLLNNWVAGPAGMVGFGILYLLRVGHEEALMRSRFGAEYDAYCARSGRLLPRFGANSPKG
jgi:protein-S-isoprenylcysteine O-methyltransferase Ste14